MVTVSFYKKSISGWNFESVRMSKKEAVRFERTNSKNSSIKAITASKVKA